METGTQQEADEMIEPGLIEPRTQWALRLIEQVRVLRDRMTQEWYEMAECLAPIKQHQLYKELGYKSWQAFTTGELGTAATTIDNYVSPFITLLGANINPADLADVQHNRVRKLAEIAEKSGGCLDPELLEAARNTGSRKNAAEFDRLIAETNQTLHIESGRRLSFGLAESAFARWSLCLEIESNLQGERVSSEYLLESMMADYIVRPDALTILQILDKSRSKEKARDDKDTTIDGT